ncbi:MAG: hypothetical protein A3H39_17725 [candidate division NC10 bacterium RIFCSPLOWO2_02_FULL_66_22]|nr:MAG: hypothetical protein A3H39_17725 [candidate division NC10 bacterium RIFCSPLOWO2_02_FULL_66_22]
MAHKVDRGRPSGVQLVHDGASILSVFCANAKSLDVFSLAPQTTGMVRRHVHDRNDMTRGGKLSTKGFVEVAICVHQEAFAAGKMKDYAFGYARRLGEKDPRCYVRPRFEENKFFI